MEIFIGIERVLIVIVGGGCIFLGYRLFLNLPERQDSEGRIKLPGDISIYVSRVGPGVFFVIFGSIIICSSLYFSITIFDSKTGNPVVRGVGFHTDSQNVVDADFPGKSEIDHSNLLGDFVILNSVRRNFKTNTPEIFLQDWGRAVQRTKFKLLAYHWDPIWGDFNTFKRNLELNEQDKLGPSYKQPVNMFFITMKSE